MKRVDMPLVSVLMTAYNREDFIGEAIESVLASSYDNFELIIVDDKSSDRTREIAQSYAKLDRRVRFFANDKNLGDYPNRNAAASHARGTYLKFLDSDDLIYAHGLATMVEMMEWHCDAGFGLSQVATPGAPHPVRLSPHDAYRENFLVRELFGRAPGSSIIRAEAFRSVGGFSGVRQVGDHELWLRLARDWPMVTLPRDLVWDRTHGQQEKFYDSDADKAGMHVRLDLEALDHCDCPLSRMERMQATSRIKRGQSKTFWRTLVRGAGLSAALSYRTAVGLSWAGVFGVNYLRVENPGIALRRADKTGAPT